MSDNTRNFYGRDAGRVEERVHGQRPRHLPRRGRGSPAVHRDQRLEPERRGPRPVQGPHPGQHGLPRRCPGRRDRAIRRARRGPGGQPGCLTVRRVRQPAPELHAGTRLRRRASRDDHHFGRSAGATRRELREVHRTRLLGEAQGRLRLPAGRRLVPQPRPDADLRGQYPCHLQGASRAGRDDEPGGPDRRHAPSEIG